MVDYGLNDRVAIITGANNPWGIGATTALAFAREGAKVVLVYKKIYRPFDVTKMDRNGVDRYYGANAGNAQAIEAKLKETGADFIVLERDISDEAIIRAAKIAQAFGMTVIAASRSPKTEEGVEFVSLDQLLQRSDVISLHCPLTVETDHIIRSGSIRRMKDGVVIINTSRGGLVNTEDLIQGLKSGKVGAACLDVYEEEGDLFYEDFSGDVVQDDKLVRLIAMPNVIVTSHQAFLTKEALDNIASTTVSNLVKFFSGNPDESTEVLYRK